MYVKFFLSDSDFIQGMCVCKHKYAYINMSW